MTLLALCYHDRSSDTLIIKDKFSSYLIANLEKSLYLICMWLPIDAEKFNSSGRYQGLYPFDGDNLKSFHLSHGWLDGFSH